MLFRRRQPTIVRDAAQATAAAKRAVVVRPSRHVVPQRLPGVPFRAVEGVTIADGAMFYVDDIEDGGGGLVTFVGRPPTSTDFDDPNVAAKVWINTSGRAIEATDTGLAQNGIDTPVWLRINGVSGASVGHVMGVMKSNPTSLDGLTNAVGPFYYIMKLGTDGSVLVQQVAVIREVEFRLTEALVADSEATAVITNWGTSNGYEITVKDAARIVAAVFDFEESLEAPTGTVGHARWDPVFRIWKVVSLGRDDQNRGYTGTIAAGTHNLGFVKGRLMTVE